MEGKYGRKERMENSRKIMEKQNQGKKEKKYRTVRQFAAKAAALVLASCVLTGSPAANRMHVSAKTAEEDLQKKTEKIVNRETGPKDSEKKKLKKLFSYIENDYEYARKVGFEAYDGWEKDYALEMLKDKKGSCYHYAAAYAYLAKAASDYDVRIGLGQTNGFSGRLQSHAWVEIRIDGKWYICDPNMDKYAQDSSLKYFLKKRSSLKKTYNKYKDAQYVTVSF